MSDFDKPPDAPVSLPTVTIGVPGATSTVEMDDIPRGTALGRYMVLSKIGAGGMGLVYSAYDPELDRKVAVKLLRVLTQTASEGGGNESPRLIREAQAMARLAHPNVLHVYDVGACEGRLYMAMELVEGTTLRQWLKERPRHWREVVEIFKAAGRGLAAAHAAGIVHRDFKPENVLVGKDGRPQVTDFGIARALRAEASTDDPPSPGAGGDVLGRPLSELGTVEGTPGYTAPEQYKGEPGDARADQFSFCVALYEALYRESLYKGQREAVAAQVMSGKIPEAPKGKKIPTWVRRVVLRGLRKDPGERYPAMEALLADLDKDRTALWRRRASGAALAVVVGALAVGYWQAEKRHGQVCRGAERRLASVWDPTVKTDVEAAFRKTGKSYAEDTLGRVEQSLDRYARDWVGMHTEACEATRVRGEQSDELLSLRMACLDERLEELRVLAQLFARADATIVQNASKAAHALSALSVCADTKTLLSPIKAPADPAARAKVDEIRKRLAEVKALRAAGQFRQGMERVSPLAAASQELGHAPLTAEVLAVLGQLEQEEGDYKRAEDELRKAMLAALAGRHDAIAADASSSLAYVVGYRMQRFDEAIQLGALAEVLVERAGAGGPIEVDFLVSMAAVEYVRGKTDAALALERRAVELIEKTPQAYGGSRWSRAHNNLGASLRALGRHEEALEHYRRAIEIAERELGPKHPFLATPLGNAANAYNSLGRFREARAHADRAYAIAMAEFGPENWMRGLTQYLMAQVRLEQGMHAEATSMLRELAALFERKYGATHPWVAGIASTLGDALRRQRKYGEARPWYERAVAIMQNASGADAARVAAPLFGLGELYLAQGRAREAVAVLERAERYREHYLGEPMTCAAMDFALARALMESRRDAKRALALARQARDTYVKASPDDKDRLLGDIDAWLASRERTSPR